MNQSITLDDGDELLTTAEVAALTKFSPATLMSWRCRGNNGPRYEKIGRFVRYKKSEVLAWLKLVSTSVPITPAYMALGDEPQQTDPRPWMQNRAKDQAPEPQHPPRPWE